MKISVCTSLTEWNWKHLCLRLHCSRALHARDSGVEAYMKVQYCRSYWRHLDGVSAKWVALTTSSTGKSIFFCKVILDVFVINTMSTVVLSRYLSCLSACLQNQTFVLWWELNYKKTHFLRLTYVTFMNRHTFVDNRMSTDSECTLVSSLHSTRLCSPRNHENEKHDRNEVQSISTHSYIPKLKFSYGLSNTLGHRIFGARVPYKSHSVGYVSFPK